MQRSLAEFLAMGGYGAFVWTCYAAWVVVMGLNIWAALKAHADARRQALRRLAVRESGTPDSGE